MYEKTLGLQIIELKCNSHFIAVLSVVYSVSCCRLSLPVQSSVYLLLAYENGTVELHSMKPLPQEIGERQKLLANYLIGLL